MSRYTSQALAAIAALTMLSSCTSGSGSGRGGDGPPRGGPGAGPGGPGGHGFEGAMAPPIALMLTAADANHDLNVSSAEASAAFDAEWTHADANADGKVSGFEFEAWSLAVLGGPESEPTRIALDPDLDGAVTPAEFKTRLGEIFSAMDRNHDGSLSRSELLVKPQLRMRNDGPRGGGPPGGRPPGGGGRGPGGGRPGQ